VREAVADKEKRRRREGFGGNGLEGSETRIGDRGQVVHDA